ncbi:flavin-containing monooxygenase [Streptomyces sp. RTd22]|uniref:flavin-containing monooxygenase n=1 Tax=Streptomyces sp. RTd22 TaxID=1841249 RepID=UPI0007C43F33|nr:NAD(P)/FAD-dependent oxidoreductase [Streptomyces sp. RTd22]
MADSQASPSFPSPAHHDAVVVGAGFAGLYALHRLRGLGLSVRCLDAASGVGGTWFWNRYPGARCDVESMDYSYSFSPELEQEWVWTERYPAQPEILRYLEHVADRFDLRRDIRLETRLTRAVFDERDPGWDLTTDRGGPLRARFLVMATGCLSTARVPDLPGLDSFQGATYHTGHWPHEGVDFRARRVGVIGTGSSGTQAIPLIAAQAAHTTVFQRTANFSLPARNRPLDPAEQRALKARYREHRAMVRYSPNGTGRRNNDQSALEVSPEARRAEYEARWQEGGGGFIGAFNDLLADERANDTAADFIRSKIRDIVHDPAVAELLVPRGFPVGSKRVTVDTGYYATYNRDNVTLVDVDSSPIEKIVPTGVRTADATYELDSIVFATGFDAITGAVLAVDIRGRGGRSLREKWAAGPRTYLGLATAGFPNLFLITGPGSPSVISNMVVSIEQHVDWIADLLHHARHGGMVCAEADEGAEDTWVAHVNEVADRTLFPRGASWYTGANVPGKPRVFMPYVGGVGTYRRHCESIAERGYPGFRFLPGA